MNVQLLYFNKFMILSARGSEKPLGGYLSACDDTEQKYGCSDDRLAVVVPTHQIEVSSRKCVPALLTASLSPSVVVVTCRTLLSRAPTNDFHCAVVRLKKFFTSKIVVSSNEDS